MSFEGSSFTISCGLWEPYIRSLLYNTSWALMNITNERHTTKEQIHNMRLLYLQKYWASTVCLKEIMNHNNSRSMIQLFHREYMRNITVFIVSTWCRKGMVSQPDLCSDCSFAPFEQLVQKFYFIHFFQITFYRHLQLWKFVAINLNFFPSCPPTSLLNSIFNCKSINKQAISKISDLLYTHNLTPLFLLKHTGRQI